MMTKSIRCQHDQSGFTLVELLISITIMVILATVALFTMFGAQQMAKKQRCKAQIKKIHEIIAEKWEGYDARRYPMAGTPPNWWSAWYQRLVSLDPTLSQRMDPATAWKAFDRLWKIRETMRMDMPDRETDVRRIVFESQGSRWSTDTGIPPTADASFFFRRTKEKTGVGGILGKHASAECLYMIVSRARIGDASALEFFSDREIGDKDGDGLPEIWDPWGNPITFVRWPTGFSSPLQNVPNGMAIDRRLNPPDAFDILNVDTGGFFHFSLIVSAGPDGQFGFAMDRELQVAESEATQTKIDFSALNVNRNNFPPGFPPDYPTTIFGSPDDPWRLGSPFAKSDGSFHATDNIDNHSIEIKAN